MLNTKTIFQKYATEKITEEVANEIEENLKTFFTILLGWNDESEGGDNQQQQLIYYQPEKFNKKCRKIKKQVYKFNKFKKF